MLGNGVSVSLLPTSMGLTGAHGYNKGQGVCKFCARNSGL